MLPPSYWCTVISWLEAEINTCVYVFSGETVPAHQRRPPAAGLHQSLSAAGEGGSCQRARTHQPAGGWQTKSPAHHQE